MKLRITKSWTKIVTVGLVLLLIPSLFGGVAFADIESLQGRVDELNSQVNDVQQKTEKAKKRLTEAQSRYEDACKKVDECMDIYNSALSAIKKYQPNVNELSEKSFAAAFALVTARPQIPSEIFNDDLFNWQVNTFLVDGNKPNIDIFVEYYQDICNIFVKYENYYNQAKLELENINKEIDNLENIYKNASNELATSGAELARLKELKEKYSLGDGLYKGMFCHPCPKNTGISEAFGADRGEYLHKGVDYAANSGTPIYAATDGVVTYCHSDGDHNQGYGNCVFISHSNGLVTKYFHCQSVLVKEGQQVTRGQQIATVGNTGDSTGPHLHFQTEKNNMPIDPIPLIDEQAPIN